MNKETKNQSNEQQHDHDTNSNSVAVNAKLITDELLMAYWQGDVEPAIATQIEADCALMARAETLLRRYQQRLQPLPPPRAVANSTNEKIGEAISDEEIGAYHLGLVSPERAQVIARFLKRNPSRAQELQLLDSYLAELEDELPAADVPATENATPSFLTRATRSIQRLIAVPVTAPANNFALLGDTAQDEQHYEINGVQIYLTVQEDETAAGCKSLYGLITGSDMETQRVALWPAGHHEQRVEAVVSPFGNFFISSLQPMTYEFCLAQGDIEIYIHNVHI